MKSYNEFVLVWGLDTWLRPSLRTISEFIPFTDAAALHTAGMYLTNQFTSKPTITTFQCQSPTERIIYQLKWTNNFEITSP